MCAEGTQQKEMECCHCPHSNPVLPGQQLRPSGWYPVSISEPVGSREISMVWVIMENVAEGRGLGSWSFWELYEGFGLNCHSHRCWLPCAQRPGHTDR